MKNYHSILEVPKDASKEQIRARYKQLVRIFHPDRYSDPKDKEFVEERMREINEAYNALVNPSRTPPREGNEALPQPVVLPPNGLDFGKLPWGSDQTLTFHVGNVGGAVRRFKLAYSEENSWFRVTEGSRVHPTKQFPLRFGVAVDTHALEPGKNYSGWIDIEMDDVTTRINLHVHVVTMRSFIWLTPRVATILGLLLLGLILVLPQMLDFNTPIFSQNRPAANSAILWQQDLSDAGESAQRAVGPRLSSGNEKKPADAAANPLPPVVSQSPEQPTASEASTVNTTAGEMAADAGETNSAATALATATPTERPAAANTNVAKGAIQTATATRAFLTSQPTAIPIEPPAVARNAVVTATRTSGPTHSATATDAATATHTATNAPTPTSVKTPTPISATATDTATVTDTATATERATESPTTTETPTDTATATDTATESPTTTETPTATATSTPRPTNTPRPTDTKTPQPTPQPAPTATETPSQTPTQTDTSTPDFSPYGIFVTIPQGQVVSVHSDIFVESDAVAQLDAEVRAAAIGRTFDNAWTRVRLHNAQEGWLLTESVLIEPTQLETLPIVAPDSSN